MGCRALSHDPWAEQWNIILWVGLHTRQAHGLLLGESLDKFPINRRLQKVLGLGGQEAGVGRLRPKNRLRLVGKGLIALVPELGLIGFIGEGLKPGGEFAAAGVKIDLGI